MYSELQVDCLIANCKNAKAQPTCKALYKCMIWYVDKVKPIKLHKQTTLANLT